MSNGTYVCFCINELHTLDIDLRAKFRAFGSYATEGQEIAVDYGKQGELPLPQESINTVKIESRLQEPEPWRLIGCYPVNNGDEILVGKGGLNSVQINGVETPPIPCPGS